MIQRFCFAILLLLPVFSQAQQTAKIGQIAPGTEWATPVYFTASGKPGPTILITGGIHGNEPAGAEAADQIRHWPILKGRLIVIPRVNKKGLAKGTRRIPDFSREVSDLNRNFPKTGAPDQAQTELAKAIWEFVKLQKPDWVIDLHEGFDINRQNPKSVGSSILCNPNKTTKPLFEKALATVNASIQDPEKYFILKSKTMTANGSLVRASMERLGAVGAILETTYADQPIALRIRQHRLMAHQLLSGLGFIDCGPDDLVFRKPGESLNYIAIYRDTGIFGNGPDEIIKRLGQQPKKYATRIISGSEIRSGKLKDFDAVIFPGGSGSKQGASLGEEGREKVRHFISEGGSYIGICGGCYLACENFSWGLKILDAKTLSSKWRRGRATLDLAFTTDKLGDIPLKLPHTKVLYVNGPVVGPANSDAIPDYKTVAYFKTETSENGSPAGIQIDSPAIMRGSFGKGKVVGISPHPELTDGLRDVLPALLQWSIE